MKKPILLLSLIIPMAIPAMAAETYDAVAKGRHVFQSMGCNVCHAIEKDDVSVKTGPNLYGVFLTNPRSVETVVAESGQKSMVKADQHYFIRSVRQSWDELAVAESGPTKGAAFPQIMPSFAPEVISNDDLDAIWHYLRTKADPEQAGPKKVMLKAGEAVNYASLIEIPHEVLVTARPRVFRVRLGGLSGRAVSVGFPNGMHYAFDPQQLSVRRVWTGGFLNLKEERSGRAGLPSAMGQGAKVLWGDQSMLVPLAADGSAISFAFKEPDPADADTIRKYLAEAMDPLDRLASVDAEYLGYRFDPATAAPVFRIRVGKNTFDQSVSVGVEGRIQITLQGVMAQEQKFRWAGMGLTNVAVDGGELKDGVWTLPANAAAKSYRLSAQLAGAGIQPMLAGAVENLQPQALVIKPTVSGKLPIKLPAGYEMRTWEAPMDLHGRKQLFEPTGIAVAKDGTVVMSTRAAGVWRIRDGKWSQFAEGTLESLGVWIEDDHGDRVVITQKPELTRLIDSDGDGRADRYDTVCDDFGFHDNYHEYVHGPVRDAKGNYYFTLNLAHPKKGAPVWTGGAATMATMGGYRGWACRVTPEGKFEPLAVGLRSPAGLGIAPDGRLWYAENQGDFVGSSKWYPLEPGAFYGHAAGLVDLPGMKPGDEAIAFKHWKNKIHKPALWFPHGKLANSPGHPAWDTTGGKFGIYQGQVFIGDQTLSTLLRVVTEKVDGVDQGCVMPFAGGLASGVMRPCFLPDGSLLLGQTGRGWGANGGSQDGLQQIVWDGKTVAADIASVRAEADGFGMRFTQPLDAGIDGEALAKRLKIESWFYQDSERYGSAEMDRRADVIRAVEISADRRTARIRMDGFGKPEAWTGRMYHFSVSEAPVLFGQLPVWNALEAYFTLQVIPKS